MPGWIIAAVVAVVIIGTVVVLARRQSRAEVAMGYGDLAPVERKANPPLSAYVVCYLLFFGLLAASVAIFFSWTVTIKVLLAVFGLRWEVNNLIYLFGMAVIGLILFILVAAAEPYLRGGVERKELARRALRMGLALGAVWLVGVIIRLAAMTAL